MEMYQVIASIATGLVAIWAAVKLFFEFAGRKERNNSWLKTAPAKVKDIDIRLRKVEEGLDASWRAIDSNRDSLKKDVEHIKKNVDLLCKGVSSLLESNIHDGNNKDELRKVKSELDNVKSMG